MITRQPAGFVYHKQIINFHPSTSLVDIAFPHARIIKSQTFSVNLAPPQLNQKNAAYSLQYARITADELSNALDER